MNLDDPRHGTYAGAAEHWKQGESPCERCQPIASKVRKRNRHMRAVGRPANVSSMGTLRRLEALRALGYSIMTISRECGISEKTLRNPWYRGTTVHRTTAEAVAAVYDRLHMIVPEGPYAKRERRAAARRGFVPPLAWDDIDDPDETPAATYTPLTYRPNTELLAEWHHLRGLGVSTHQICKQLGVTYDAIEKALTRQDGAA